MRRTHQAPSPAATSAAVGHRASAQSNTIGRVARSDSGLDWRDKRRDEELGKTDDAFFLHRVRNYGQVFGVQIHRMNAEPLQFLQR
jgi:hypothetical protein